MTCTAFEGGAGDRTHLVVVCGVYCPFKLRAFAACNLAYEQGAWQVRYMDFYYVGKWR